MRTSFILNTHSLDPHARVYGNQWRSVAYAARALMARETLINASRQFDEVIVAGVYEEDKGRRKRWQYVHVPPRMRDTSDALWQREAGARHSTGDVLVFCHDDHAPTSGFVRTLRRNYWRTHEQRESWDLLVPKRTHGETGEVLESGAEDDYMGGHCLVMKRSLWARVPWTRVATAFWDWSMTRMWREAGAQILHVDDLEHVDLEAAEGEA